MIKDDEQSLFSTAATMQLQYICFVVKLTLIVNFEKNERKNFLALWCCII